MNDSHPTGKIKATRYQSTSIRTTIHILLLALRRQVLHKKRVALENLFCALDILVRQTHIDVRSIWFGCFLRYYLHLFAYRKLSMSPTYKLYRFSIYTCENIYTHIYISNINLTGNKMWLAFDVINDMAEPKWILCVHISVMGGERVCEKKRMKNGGNGHHFMYLYSITWFILDNQN